MATVEGRRGDTHDFSSSGETRPESICHYIAKKAAFHCTVYKVVVVGYIRLPLPLHPRRHQSPSEGGTTLTRSPHQWCRKNMKTTKQQTLASFTMLKQGKHLWNLHTLHLGIGRLAEAQKYVVKKRAKIIFLRIVQFKEKIGRCRFV